MCTMDTVEWIHNKSNPPPLREISVVDSTKHKNSINSHVSMPLSTVSKPVQWDRIRVFARLIWVPKPYV